MSWKDNILNGLKELGAEITPEAPNVIIVNSKKIQLVDAGSEPEDVSADIILHEDIYHSRPNQLMSRLRSIAGLNSRRVHGRKTKVQSISKEQAEDFINEHHLMTFGGGKFFYGLFEQDELVSVAVFSRIVFMKNENPSYHSTELVRYCSKTDCTVLGGLDKFVKHFFAEHDSDDLITYIDKEWSDGSSYETIGFEKVDETEPLKFLVERESSERKLEDGSGVLPGHYSVRNRGNLKLRRLKA